MKKEAQFIPYWTQYQEAVKAAKTRPLNRRALTEFRWMLEEYRVSLFAQELRTPEPVSPKRLDAKWQEILSA